VSALDAASRQLRPFVPASLRSVRRRFLRHLTLRRTVARLASIARGDKPVIVGPWVSEVGFELLYWIPFLRWVVSRYGIDPARVTAMSRGGVASWYAGIASRYVDVFEVVSVDRLRSAMEERADRTGMQKQLTVAPFEAELLRAACTAVGYRDFSVVHPSLMYNLFRPFWWSSDVSVDWALDYLRFAPLSAPPPVSLPLPQDYVAVKFYFNDGFPDTSANRDLVDRLLRRLADEGPVVSLATGLRVDDHRDCDARDDDRIFRLPAALDPVSNLAVQSTVVAGARRYIGTYGGFAYLAPLYGVPALALYSRQDGFSGVHLDMAAAACAALRSVLQVSAARDLDLDVVARPVATPL